MNLVLSGPIEPSLLASVERLSRPLRLTPVRQRAWRLESVDDSALTRRAVADCCASALVDHAFVESHVKFEDMKVLALDMDSTLITIECIDELSEFAGRREEVAAITEATMRGEVADFVESLTRRVSVLRGLDVDVLRRVYEERLKLSPGAEILIEAARNNDIYILLISGGFTYFADRLRDLLHLNASYANVPETHKGKLTGRITGTVIDGAAKAAHVKRAIELMNCKSTEAVVIGDGSNDIPMMQCVEHSVAYRAKQSVSEIARMTIKYGDLATTLDFL